MKIYTVTIRENIVNDGKVTGNTARQDTVRADSVVEAAKKVEAAIKKAQPDHYKNHEVINVALAHEVADD
jgi:hypothetical protein